MTAMRSTIRGTHEGSCEPLVVDGAKPGTPGQAHGGDLQAHQVLVLRAPPHGSGPRPGAGPGHRLGAVDGRSGVVRREVIVDGWRFEVDVEPERRAALRDRARRERGDAGRSGPAEVRAIIPGVVVSVAVAAGDEVEAGQELLVVEAMKMQNELRAPRAGRVGRVAVGERSTIEVGDVLVVIE